MSTPTSRKAAMTVNSAVYNTGKPCANGHLANRSTVNGTCVECAKTANEKSASKRRPEPLKEWFRMYENSDCPGFYNPWIIMYEDKERWSEFSVEQKHFVWEQITLTAPEYFMV